jgi:hypothetical protein
MTLRKAPHTTTATKVVEGEVAASAEVTVEKEVEASPPLTEVIDKTKRTKGYC